MQVTFWYVYKVGGGPPRYKHSTYDLAVTEAQRLAEMYGGEYEVLEAKAKVTPVPKTVVETFCQYTYAYHNSNTGETTPF